MIDMFLGSPPVDDWRTYTPVLRAKASEWQALKQLTKGVRERIAPVLEFVPEWEVPAAASSGRKSRSPQTPDDYVERMIGSCVASTPPGTRSFVYFGLAGPDAIWRGLSLWGKYAALVPQSVRAIPLADLSLIGSAASLPSAVQSHSEVGIRIQASEVDARLEARIKAASVQLGLSEKSVHILVDLKGLPTAVSHSQIRAALRDANRFASVTVLAGVFPVDLTKYQPGVAAEPRVEWTAWWADRSSTPARDRMLAFGDYTTQCALYQPSPAVPGSVSLRYTTDDTVLVFRGRQSNSGTGLGHDQMHGHCRLLVARQDYDGAAFSAGDQQMHCWTDPANGTGNAAQWRTASVVHHITHVVAQLNDQVGSSAAARAWARAQPPAPCV